MAKQSRIQTKKNGSNSYLIAAVAVIAILIIGTVYYYSDYGPKKSKDYSKLKGNVSLAKSNITVEPFVEPAVWAFKDVYNAVRHLDKKYESVGADLHSESLRKGVWVNTNAADDYLADLEFLSRRIGNNTVASQSKSIANLLEGRQKMIISEKYFQQALSYGMHGVFTNNYNCEDREIILTASKLYNQSQMYGWRAMAALDRSLSYYEGAREYIGINTPTQKNRPAFYDNVFLDIANLVTTNYAALNDYCDGTVRKQNNRGVIVKGTLPTNGTSA